MERETGIEPAAPTLARSCSTTELFPHSLFKKTIVIVSKLNNKSQGLMKNFKTDFKTDQNSQNPFYLKNEIFKLNLIYKMTTLLLYQKSTKLILKNVLFSIKAHILFSIFPLSFLFFLKILITT